MSEPTTDSKSDEPTPDLSAVDVDDTIEFTPELSPEVRLAAELNTANDKILRLTAELQNLRNRQSRELADTIRYAALPVLRDILPVLDNVDRAIEASSSATDIGALVEGFRLMRHQLATALSQHHCEEIAALGLTFDPEIHQAILQQPSPEVAAGQVLLVAQSGYKLHDRVVRPAQVIVSSGPAT